MCVQRLDAELCAFLDRFYLSRIGAPSSAMRVRVRLCVCVIVRAASCIVHAPRCMFHAVVRACVRAGIRVLIGHHVAMHQTDPRSVDELS